tara:strand:- start:2281 stop:2538 length:258 start_codon:yes stop_codon:yes gene_type:complete
MDKLEKAEGILRSIAIDIDEYFDNKPQKKKFAKKATVKKTYKKKSNGKVLSCKYCDADGFIWGETLKGWRLFDAKTNTEHNCGGA